jgi:hypothetical protein
MSTFVFRRLALLPIVAVGVTLLIFALLQLLTPAMRASLYIQDPKQLNALPEIIRKYRLDETGFNVEIELAAQSASRENLTEVPIDYRPRIGQKKLSTWTGFSILRAAFSLARRYNAVLLYSSLTGLSVVPAAVVLSWVGIMVTRMELRSNVPTRCPHPVT